MDTKKKRKQYNLVRCSIQRAVRYMLQLQNCKQQLKSSISVAFPHLVCVCVFFSVRVINRMCLFLQGGQCFCAYKKPKYR